MPDRIEQHIDLAAPPERVWRALTDHVEFGQWFRVAIEAPFAVGAVSRGNMTMPGYEHVLWHATVTVIEPPRRFAYTWHPYAIEPGVDYSTETPTLVEFALAPTASGTRLTVVETGFDALPEARRADALRSNTGGWTAQLDNIHSYVGAHVGG